MASKIFTADDPALPMNYPGYVFRLLRAEGYQSSALLAETGLEEDHLKDLNFRCGFQPLRRLFLNAIEQSKDPDLGVTLALKFEPTYVGLPAYAAMNASSFQDGLYVLEKFFFLTFPAFEFRFFDKQCDLKSSEVAIRLRPKFPFNGIEYFAFSSAIVVINGLLKAMLRIENVATRAEMTEGPQEGFSTIEARVGFPIRFNAAENQIFFPEELLKRPLPGADPINHARLLVLCDQLAAEISCYVTPVTQITALLEDTHDLTRSLSDVAAELGYSERGLRRQLDRSGTSYRKLLDHAREQRARRLLSGSTQPIKTIAGALGFETSSNFARSFRRWTGLSPTEFREQTLAQDDAGRK